MDLVALEVLRMMSAAARCGKALSVADNFIRAQLANHLVLIGGGGNRDGLEARSLRVLHRKQPEAPPIPSTATLAPGCGSAQRSPL